MKIVEWVLGALLWVVGALGLVFVGWCLKGYQNRRECVK